MTQLYPVISAVIMLSVLVYETTRDQVFAKYALTKSDELYNGLDKLNESCLTKILKINKEKTYGSFIYCIEMIWNHLWMTF